MLTDVFTSLEFSKKEKIFTELKKYIGKSFDNKKLLVAVSGGVDSMFVSVMIYKFFDEEKLNLDNLFFVHLNHGVREESEEEELFVRDFFRKTFPEVVTNLLLFSPLYQEETPPGKTEEKLRIWRYGEFEKICQEKDIDFVVTGHHLNDRVESSFLHMLRGAGLQGFLSMQFCEHHHLLNSAKILRPLLSLSKGEILALVEKYKIPYMQDESNFDPEISKRNKLRNIVLPQLFELAHKNTETENSFLESMKNVYLEMSSYPPLSSPLTEGGLMSILEKIKMSEYWHAEWAYKICVGEITTESLLMLLKGLGVAQNVSKKNLSEIVNFLNNKKSGHKFLNGVTFFVSHGVKYMIKAERFFWTLPPVTNPVFGISSPPNPLSSKLERGNFPQGAVIRYPKKGDRYKGKTRNQFCLNQKIPVFWRNFVPVVELDGEIVGYEWEGV